MDMTKRCFMNPVTLPWDELICLSGNYRGVVFLNLGDESAPHFILDLVLELEREKVAPDISPCEIFEGSYLIEKASGHQRDLALVLKNIESDALARLNHWVSGQAPDAVMPLSDYAAKYKVDIGES